MQEGNKLFVFVFVHWARQDASLLENWRCDGSFPGSMSTSCHSLNPLPQPEKSWLYAPSYSNRFHLAARGRVLFRTLWSRSRNVVLVGRTIDQGCWEFGMGRDWGGFKEGEVSSRATWGQGGQDRTTQKEGFQVSKRGLKGELAKGAKKGDCAITVLSICICEYNNCLNVIVSNQPEKCDERTWEKPVYFLLWLINLKYNSN